MGLIQTIKKLAASQSVMSWFEFNTAPTSMSDGGLANAQCDGSGRLLVSPAPLADALDFVSTRPKKALHYVTPSLETGEVAKAVQAGPGGQLMRLTVRNKNAAVRWAHVYNQTTSPPAANTIPIDTFVLPAGVVAGSPPVTRDYPMGLEGVLGLVVAVSANEFKYDATGVTAADHYFLADYYP